MTLTVSIKETDYLAILVEKGAMIESKDKYDQTVLHIAAIPG